MHLALIKLIKGHHGEVHTEGTTWNVLIQSTGANGISLPVLYFLK